MPQETYIRVSTGSDNRSLSVEVILTYVAQALRGVSVSGTEIITLCEDGSVDIGLERVYTPPERPKMEPLGRRKSKD